MSRAGRFGSRRRGSDSVDIASARLRTMWRVLAPDFLEMSWLELSSPNWWIETGSVPDIGASEFLYGARGGRTKTRIDDAFPRMERAELRCRLRAVARAARREERRAISAWIEHHSSGGSLVWQMSATDGGRGARIEFLDAASVIVSTSRGRQRRVLRRLVDLAGDPGLYLVACARHLGWRHSDWGQHCRLHFTTLDGTSVVLIVDIVRCEHV